MMKKIIIKEELKKGNNHPERLPHEKEIERKNIKVKIRKIR